MDIEMSNQVDFWASATPDASREWVIGVLKRLAQVMAGSSEPPEDCVSESCVGMTCENDE
jgi:hypothetical protein